MRNAPKTRPSEPAKGPPRLDNYRFAPANRRRLSAPGFADFPRHCGSMGLDGRAASPDPRLSLSIHVPQLVQASSRARRFHPRRRCPHTHLGGARDPPGSRDSVSDGAAWRRVAAKPAQRCRVRWATAARPHHQWLARWAAHGATFPRWRPRGPIHAAEHD